jgi:23S rRNA (pseudouridine1915-N3)-methyltransferase
MKISVIAVSSNQSEYKSFIDDYLKRISRSIDIEFICIKEEKLDEKNKQEIIKKEETRILEKLKNKKLVIALDKKGKQLSSVEFASFIKEHIEDRVVDELCFVIGGAFGFSQEFLNKIQYKFSLSKMTFTHQMVRIILLEQIYRAFEILRGSKYHK